MAEVRPHSLPTDSEADTMVELVRQRLLGYGIFSVTFAGVISMFRAVSELVPDQHLAETHGLALFIGAVTFVTYTFINIYIKYSSYLSGF
jgi:hypothetical protein